MPHPAIQKAKDIVSATEWEGDLRVNMTNVIGAGKVLAKRVDELEEALRAIVLHQESIGGGLAVMSATRRIAASALGED